MSWSLAFELGRERLSGAGINLAVGHIVGNH